MARPQPRYHLHNKTQQKGRGSWDWQRLEVLGEEADSAWWVVGGGWVGEVPARRKRVATALTPDPGSNAVSLLPQGRDTCSVGPLLRKP